MKTKMFLKRLAKNFIVTSFIVTALAMLSGVDEAHAQNNGVFGMNPLGGDIGGNIGLPGGPVALTASLADSAAADVGDSVGGSEWSSELFGDLFGEDGALGFLGGIFGGALGVLGWVGDLIGDVLSLVADFIGKLTGDILSFTRPLLAKIRGSFRKSNQFYSNSFGNPLDGLFSGIGELLGSITGLIASLGDLTAGLGQNIVGVLNINLPGLGGGFSMGQTNFGLLGVLNINLPGGGVSGSFDIPDFNVLGRVNINTGGGRSRRRWGNGWNENTLAFQASFGPQIRGSFLGTSVYDELDVPGAPDLITSFNGFSTVGGGYRRSPVFFNPRQEDTYRSYPQLGYDAKTATNNDDVKRKSLKNLNLGVNEEIRKTTMTPYQPVSALEMDHANDEISRDNLLGLFRTVQGIAILTLQYLDKTVAAGLLSTKQEAAMNTTNALLQDISRAQARMSDPARALLYSDTDDKYEECLRYVSAKARGTETEQDARIALSYKACSPDGKLPKKGGVYAFCRSCADRTPIVNAGSDVSFDENGNPYTSVMEKVFFGIKYPTAEGDPSKSREIQLNETVNVAKAFYGDVVLQSIVKKGASSNFDDTAKGSMQIKYEYPIYSVQERVKILRDGNPDESCSQEGATGSTKCPVTGVKVKYGICPALTKVLLNWPPTKENFGQLREYWIEASYGKALDARDIEDLLQLGNVTPPVDESISEKWEKEGPGAGTELGRYIANFCDASAVAAFKRLHYQLKSTILDHMTLNRRISDAERDIVNQLMGRVDEQIALGEKDAEAGYAVVAMSTGMGIIGDRTRVRNALSAAAANRAASDLANKLSGIRNVFGSQNTFPVDGAAEE